MLAPGLQRGRSRILICRLSHIGDCILTLPMLTSLRRARPDAWIAWATERPCDQLLSRHPQLDELITIPKGWMKRPSSILAMRRKLREYSFDITIDPQSIAKSAMLAWVSGASLRLGFSGVHGREGSPWFNNRLVQTQSTHLVDRSLELLTALEIQPGEAQFELPLRESTDCYVEQFLTQRGLEDARFLVINPGASWPSKRWENSRFAEVARQLYEKTGLPSVVTWAGDMELAWATAICTDSGGAAMLAPKTDLPQLASLLKRAEIFVGCDTGPLHLAAAAGTVCVGLYGPTRPQDSGAYGQRHFAIQNEYQGGSSRQRRRGSNRAMKLITADQVVDICLRALATVRVALNSTDDSADRAA
jgi:lipopolysaccharide heptosyltransferase I